MSNTKDVLVPDVGGEEVEIIDICVSVGDEVQAEDSLITVESDKASMDIPAPFAGKVAEILVETGDKVGEGKLIMKFETSDNADAEPSDSEQDKGDKQQEKSDDGQKAESGGKAQGSDKQEEDKEAKSKSSGKTGILEVKVPDIGDASEVEVIEILVSEGDEIEEETGLITLETDKATMDVPSPKAGKVKAIKVSTGDKVSEGSLILMLEVEGESADKKESEDKAENDKKTSENGSQSADKEKQDKDAGEKTAKSKSSSQSGVIEVKVPDIGDASEVEVIEILVSEGDEIEEETGLITLETDKATMDVPSPKAGKVKGIKVSTGDKVSEGSLILMLEVEGDSSEAEESDAAESDDKAQKDSGDSQNKEQTGKSDSGTAASGSKPPPVPHHPSAGEKPSSGKVHASPAVRRLAREFGVDLGQVKGSGRKDRILKEDVQSYVKYELSRPKMTAGVTVASGSGGLQVLAPPKVDFSKFGEVEELPLTRIQKISGPNLHRNWVTIPHVTQFEEADITELEAFRKQQNQIAEKKKLGVKITPLVFIIKAVADALKAHPVFNTSLSESGETLIQKKYYHIGIAVDTPGGLVVPVVRDVDKKGIHELSEELGEISKKARDGKLKAADMQGSCFTISSLGGIGGTAFTPIVNAPDVAILGVSRSEMKPKWNGKEFEPRLMLPLSLSYDHRVIDGAVAARFAVHLSDVLGDIRQMLL